MKVTLVQWRWVICDDHGKELLASDAIELFRREFRLTNIGVAKILRVSEQAVKQYLSGLRTPGPEQIWRLGQYLEENDLPLFHQQLPEEPPLLPSPPKRSKSS